MIHTRKRGLQAIENLSCSHVAVALFENDLDTEAAVDTTRHLRFMVFVAYIAA